MKRKISNLLVLSLVFGTLAATFWQEDLAGQLTFVGSRIKVEQTGGLQQVRKHDSGQADSSKQKNLSKSIIVIDPGHGGMDGGAQAGDGTSEKDINLAISKKLKRQLEKDGVQVILTRSRDEGLYDKNADGAIRTLKTQDMKRRRQIIEEAEADLTVSIHLNSFTQDSSVRGAQVFYPSEGDPEVVKQSKTAAKILQDGFNGKINTEKPRGEMGKNDVFLLRNARSPIVIAECGFLSNPEDLQNLKKRNYQEEIVKVLHKSVCSYLRQKSTAKAQ